MLFHNAEENKFEWTRDGVSSFILYNTQNQVLNLYHSEVPLQHRGKGIGKKMVEATFEYIIEKGMTAKATCSFIRAVAKRNPTKWKSIITT